MSIGRGLARHAGGGGFALFFARPEYHGQIKRRLDRLVHVPLGFENSGSQIIFFDAEREYRAEEMVRDAAHREAARELAEVIAL